MELILVLALLIEAVINTVKWLVESQFNWERITAISVSIAVCILTQVDIFKEAGLPLILPYVGSILTGLIISRGANVLADLYKAFKAFGVLLKLPFPVLSATVKTDGNKEVF